MIAVTGEPRSGMSVTMIILKALGYILAGEQYVSEDHTANPDGVWEVPRVAKNGLSWDMYKGKTNLCPNLEDFYVIKLISYGLTRSDHNIFDLLVVCMRDPLEVCKSQYLRGYRPMRGSFLLDYIHNQQEMFKWIANKNKQFTIINYNSLIQDPKWEVSQLAEFLTARLGDRFTSEDIIRATKCVNPAYYRNRQ